MPSSMTTTTGTSTIKRTHIQQLIDAWNGVTSVPLVLNGQGTDYTPLTIKANGVSAPFQIIDANGATVFSIGTTGVISPSVSTTSGTVSVGTTQVSTPSTPGIFLVSPAHLQTLSTSRLQAPIPCAGHPPIRMVGPLPQTRYCKRWKPTTWQQEVWPFFCAQPPPLSRTQLRKVFIWSCVPMRM